MDAKHLDKLLKKALSARADFDAAVSAIERYIGMDVEELHLTSDELCDYDAESLLALMAGR